jgi:DNA-binding beta-propeller fold protein YncE
MIFQYKPKFFKSMKYNLVFLGLLILITNGQVQAAQCEVNSVALGDALFDMPGAMVATSDGNWLLALDEIAMDIKVVSITKTKQKVVTSVRLQGIEPSSLTLSPDGTRLYVGGALDTGIAVVDISAAEPTEWQVINTWSKSGDFEAILFDPTTPRLLVADRQALGVRVLSHTDGSELATLAVPNGRCRLPVDLAVKGAQLFVACETDNTVAVFDLTTLTHLKDIGVGNSPVALLAHPNAERLFVANLQAGTLSIINTSNLEELPQTIADAALLSAPKAMAWLGGELWILDQSQSKLVRYTDKLEASVCMGLGDRPAHFVVALSSGLLYVANSRGLNYVTVDMVNRKVKTYPQVLMAGFDPMFIDGADNQVRIVAVVEEGINPVAAVGYAQIPNTFMGHHMELVGVIPLDAEEKRYGLVYENTIPFQPNFLPHGSVAQAIYSMSYYSLFGNQHSQFVVSARDDFDQFHHYPTWEYTFEDWPRREVFTTGMAISQQNYAKPGTRRDLPQVIMAGFSPMLMDWSDEDLTVMAVVRAGSSPIQSVTLNNVGDESEVKALNKVIDLPNGDQLYQCVFWKKEGDTPFLPENQTPQKIKGVWNDLFTIIVRDQNNGKHRFPDVQIGKFPAL